MRDLERKNIVSTIVTQNVDSLHYKAGSKSALELHGCNRDVVCLNCGYVEPRPNYQDRINELNLEWIKSNLHHPLDADDAGNSNVIEDSSMQIAKYSKTSKNQIRRMESFIIAFLESEEECGCMVVLRYWQLFYNEQHTHLRGKEARDQVLKYYNRDNSKEVKGTDNCDEEQIQQTRSRTALTHKGPSSRLFRRCALV